MAKDGTLRGGWRAGSGTKPIPMFEKITEGKDARILNVTPLHLVDLEPDGDCVCSNVFDGSTKQFDDAPYFLTEACTF